MNTCSKIKDKEKKRILDYMRGFFIKKKPILQIQDCTQPGVVFFIFFMYFFQNILVFSNFKLDLTAFEKSTLKF